MHDLLIINMKVIFFWGSKAFPKSENALDAVNMYALAILPIYGTFFKLRNRNNWVITRDCDYGLLQKSMIFRNPTSPDRVVAAVRTGVNYKCGWVTVRS